MDIYEKIKKIIAERLSLSEDEIRMDSSFLDDLGADSLDIVELVMAFEEEFDIKIPDEDAEKIETVKDVVDYVKSHLGNELEDTSEMDKLEEK